jgi:hypothetical protein
MDNIIKTDKLKNANEMTLEEIKKVLDEDVDWVRVHKELYLNDYGTSLYIWTDGDITTLSANTMYQDSSKIIGSLKCWGADVDRAAYLDGWGNFDFDTGIFISDDGIEMTEEEAILECIEEGDWLNAIDFWKEKVIEQYEDEFSYFR